MTAFLGIASAIWGAILLVIGLLVVLKFKPAVRLTRIVPLPAFYVMVGILVLGFWLGGFAILSSLVSGATGVAVITPTPAVPTIESTLAYCDYKNAGQDDANVTVREDTSRSDLVWFDADESQGSPSEASAQTNHVNMTCVRTDNIQEEAVVLLTAKAVNFRSEISSSDASEYNILEKKTQSSTVWAEEYQGEVYLSTTGVSTDASDIEKEYVTFAEGVKEEDVTITFELDLESFAVEQNYTAKYITIYQGEAKSDTVFTIGIQKVP